MKKYLALLISLFLTVQASAQSIDSVAMDSLRHAHPRIGKNFGFFISNEGGADRWFSTTRAETYPACGSRDWFNDHYRYSDNSYLDTFGINCDNRAYWDEVVDSNGTPISDHSAKLPLVFNNPCNNSQMSYLWAIGSQNWTNTIFNASHIRVECERHPPFPGREFEKQYFGFYSGSGQVGVDTAVTDGTFPLFLRGTTVESDTSKNVVMVRKGVHSAGMVENEYWNAAFLYLSWNKGFLPVSWYKIPNKKLLLRMRVRVDSQYAVNTPLFRFRISEKKIDLHDNNLQDTVGADTVLTDSVTFDGRFSHSPGSFDTIDFHVIPGFDFATKNIELFWYGQASMTFDYIDIETDIDAVADGTTAPYRSYRGLTMDHDRYLKKLFDRYKYAWDSLVDFVEIPNELPYASMNIAKRLMKMFQSQTSCVPIIILLDSGLAENPSGQRYMLEGVHNGWLPDSLYADPTLFGIEGYYIDFSMPLPIRDTITDSAAQYRWDSLHVRSFGNFAPYSQERYTTYAAGEMLYAIKSYRKAKRQCLRNESIGQRFFDCWWMGDGVALEDSAHGYQMEYTYNFRPPTESELKATGHLAISCGASGLDLYMPTSRVDTDNCTANAGIMSGKDGSHSSNFFTFAIHSDTGHTHLVSNEMFVGWKENYDTCLSLVPLLKTYGATLFLAKYIGDWWTTELDSTSAGRGGAVLPFVPTSIRAINDSGREDMVSDTDFRVLNHGYTNGFGRLGNQWFDTTWTAVNRTLVHVSEWLDTIGGISDTLLYITNLRTDDSYKIGTDTISTRDRRYITMQMKAPHLVTDVADTAQLRTMGKVRTPFVDTLPGDSLVVWLLPGDGVLIRLSPAPDSMKQMRIALNYPKIAPTNTSNKYDHGQAKFSEYVVGVSRVNGFDSLTIPSSRYSYVGIKDWQAPKVHQDSLIFQSFSSDRPEKWRHQNWTDANGIQFKFNKTLPPVILSGRRDGQLGLDSIAHPVTITTDIEGTGSTFGAIGFYDPFFVNDSTYRNYNTSSDTLQKSAPFMPHVPMPGVMPGAHPEHYGGVFLGQDPDSLTLIPNYALKAYSTHIWPWPGRWLDTTPDFTNYTFLQWQKGDVNNPDTIIYDKSLPVIFQHDYQKYTALYKVHNLVFASDSTGDIGYSYNNQRKLVYLGRDSSDRAWYRNVFASLGRIFTAKGWHPPGNAWMNWEPEELVTEWGDSTACYPSIAMHIDTVHRDTTFSYFYQQKDSTGSRRIYRTMIVNGIRHKLCVSDEDLPAESTPSAVAVDLYRHPSGDTLGQWDVVAYHTANQGIAVRSLHCYRNWLTPYVSNPLYFGTEKAQWPTLWASDSAWLIDSASSHFAWYTPVYLAWQDTTDGLTRNIPPLSPSVWDIYCRRLLVEKGALGGTSVFYGTTFVKPILIDSSSGQSNISWLADNWSEENRRPCITGIRSGDDDTMSVFVAYESVHAGVLQGIGVALTHPPVNSGWTKSLFYATGEDHFTVHDTGNIISFLKPSITATKYTVSGGTWTPKTYFYSLAFEAANQIGDCNVWHLTLDSVTRRHSPNWYLGLRNPQLSVTIQGHDSDIERMAVASNPWDGLLAASGSYRWLIHQNAGLFKANVDHTKLYDYMQTTQHDSVNDLKLVQGVGEFQVDDGVNQTWIDLAQTEDYENLDTSRQSSHFLATDNFWLPDHSTITYSPWVQTNNDSLFKESNEQLIFRLAFYDSTGAYVFTVDSLFICDTQPRIPITQRTIDISYPVSGSGHFQFERMNGRIADSGSVEEIISMKSLAALKRSSRTVHESDQDFGFNVKENPVRLHCDIDFAIPITGPVTFEVVDALGNKIDQITEQREFRAGEHVLRWIPKGAMRSGIYTITMRYGNGIKTMHVSYAK